MLARPLPAPTPLAVLLAAAGYCLLHAALRLWASPNIGTDDVEQAVFAQAWAWGYNPTQPPLFTWLLLGGYALFGPGLVAHVLLKYGLLLAVYGFAYDAARRLIADPWRAALAPAALLLLFVFGWGVHAGYTHSVLLSACQLATLVALQRVVAQRRWPGYLWLGAALGLGLLSKYSFVLFAAPLLAAGLFIPAFRPALADRRMLAALLLAGLIFLPHGMWMIGLGRNYGAVLAQMAGVDVRHSYLQVLATGFASLAEATLVFLSPFWLIAALVLWPARGSLRFAWRDPWFRLLALTVAIGLAFMATTVVLAGATYFKERRMHAVLLTVPLLALLLADRAAIEWRRLRWLAAAIAAVVLAALAGTIGQALFEPQSCRNCRLHTPIPGLVATLREAGFVGGTILAGDEHVGGNLRLAFRDARVLVPIYARFRPPEPGTAGRCLIVWNARGQGDGIPGLLGGLIAEQGVAAEAPRFVELPLLREPARVDRFGFTFAANGDGRCRPR